MRVCSATIVRSLVIFGFVYSWHRHVNLNMPDEFNTRLRYGSFYGLLTVLNFLLSIFVNFLLLVGDFIPTVRKFGQALNFSISFPANAAVFVYFWGVYFIDRELIYPRVLEQFYPFWLNSVEHALILPVALFNITRAPFEMSLTVSYGLGVVANFAYNLWVVYIFEVSGTWVYPFLEAMGKDNVLYVFFPITVVVSAIFQFIGWKINALFCPTNKKSKKN